MRPGLVEFKDPDQAVEETAYVDGATSVIGTPDDLVQRIRDMIELTGGFGTVIGFVHDWVNRTQNKNSWDLVARYVIPEVNGMLDSYRESRQYVVENREIFERAGEAIMAKIKENDLAVAALKEGTTANPAIAPHHAPDLEAAKKQA